MTAFVSDDDGATWKGGLRLDEREWRRVRDSKSSSSFAPMESAAGRYIHGGGSEQPEA
jgi:hypothetical protein